MRLVRAGSPLKIEGERKPHIGGGKAFHVGDKRDFRPFRSTEETRCATVASQHRGAEEHALHEEHLCHWQECEIQTRHPAFDYARVRRALWMSVSRSLLGQITLTFHTRLEITHHVATKLPANAEQQSPGLGKARK